MKREMKSQQRRRMLKAMPHEISERVSDPRYGAGMKFCIASIHFHDNIYNICHNKHGKEKLVESIPVMMANKLSREGLTFTNTDKFPDGTYVPLPNIPPLTINEMAGQLQSQFANVAAAPPIDSCASRTKTAMVSPEMMEINRLNKSTLR